jgi:hypothetical protein
MSGFACEVDLRMAFLGSDRRWRTTSPWDLSNRASEGEDLRTVEIPPERLARWLDNFVARHGAATFSHSAERILLMAPDGARAELAVPFPPVSGELPRALLDHVQITRTVAALLVRRGGVAVGIFAGRRLVQSKIETSYVQGRTKAGGWSQSRYARRRSDQTRQAWASAADLTATIVLPRRRDLAGLALGGDRSAVEAVLADPRLEPLRPLRCGPIHPVPDPRLAVLRTFPDRFLAVTAALNDAAQ